MRTAVWIVLMIALSPLPGKADEAGQGDSEYLKALFDADQAIRSEENRKAGIAPTMQEERDRRFAVFQLISEEELHTANDYFRAGMILHHTSYDRLDSGELVSLGTESKLLAFFLFRRAYLLGHEWGRPMMGAAYNYYLDACGEDGSKFGYKFEGRDLIWRPNVAEADKDTLKCGFDPRPYLE